jgi:hypothetical protein
MNVVSYCIYGKKELYRVGALRNIELCKKYYPGWEIWFYLAPSVEKKFAKKLKAQGAVVYYIEDVDSAFFTNYRYFACSDLRTEYVIFRDTDSRIDAREAAAVSEWLKSGKSLHIMRDHPWHGPNPPYAMMLAGMWGIKAEKLRNIKEIVFKYPKSDFWGIDQAIITQQIYPMFLNDKIVHDEFFDKIPFPIKREGSKFVGCQYDINDKPLNPEHIKILENYLNEG